MKRILAILCALVALSSWAEINIGVARSEKVYLGSTEIDAVYLGTTLMFSRPALPQIASFTATPSSRPTGQTGNTVLAWSQTGADSIRVVNSAGTVVPTPDSTARTTQPSVQQRRAWRSNSNATNIVIDSLTGGSFVMPGSWFTSGQALDSGYIHISTTFMWIGESPSRSRTLVSNMGDMTLRIRTNSGVTHEFVLVRAGNTFTTNAINNRSYSAADLGDLWARRADIPHTIDVNLVTSTRATGATVVSPTTDDHWTLTGTNTEGSVSSRTDFTRTVPVSISNVVVVNEGQTPQAVGSIIQSFRITATVTGKPFPTLSITPEIHGARSRALNRYVRNQSGNTRNLVIELRKTVTAQRETVNYTISADNDITTASATATVRF